MSNSTAPIDRNTSLSIDSSFTTLRNGELWDASGKKLRFLSFNVPNLAVIEVPWRRTTEWEQRDALRSVQLLGGRVIRVYAFSIQNPNRPFTHITFENGEPRLNEELFADFDRALAIAREYKIQIIIPFIDRWEWWGGAQTFASLVNPSFSSPNDFYTQPAVRDKFKSMVRLILNRNNTINGIPYKNDSTVLCWETGNELETGLGGPVPGEWTLDMARFIKSIDSNHLVMDGSFGRNGWDSSVLQPNNSVDILSNHYYLEPITLQSIRIGQWTAIAMLSICFLASVILLLRLFLSKGSIAVEKHIKLIQNRKIRTSLIWKIVLAIIALLCLGGIGIAVVWNILFPNFEYSLIRDSQIASNAQKAFIAGEFGLVGVSVMRPMVERLIAGTGSGALIWSLRFRSSQGGFYTHQELGGYWAYHFPGFPGNANEGFGSDEIPVMDLMRYGSSSLANQVGYSIVSNTTLEAPLLFNATSYNGRVYLRWRGSTGATSYTIEQSKLSSAGPFNMIARNVLDNKKEGIWIYEDQNPGVGTLFYRVFAFSPSSNSSFSNTISITI